MKNKHLTYLKKISSNIHNLINNHYCNLNKRRKKTSIINGFMYKLIQSQKEMSGPKATLMINLFKNVNISRSTYIDREKQIPFDLYKKIYDELAIGLSKLNDDAKYNQIIACDCTQINLRKSLSNDGLSLNKNKLSINGFVLGLYNVTYNKTISLELLNDKNERNGFLNTILNLNNNNNIYVLDRGYYSEQLINTLCTKQIRFVCRIRIISRLYLKLITILLTLIIIM